MPYKKMSQGLILSENFPFKNYGKNWNVNYGSMRYDKRNGLDDSRMLNKKLPLVDRLGRSALSAGYATVRSAFGKDSIPSAVTSRDGIKKNMKRNNQKKRFTKEEKKVARKATKKVVRTVAKKLGFSKKKQRGAFMKGPRGRRVLNIGKSYDKIVTNPLVSGIISRSGGTTMSSKRTNCITLKSQAYLVELDRTTSVTPANFVSMMIDGKTETGGQYFFCPSNACYMPGGSNFVAMSRMFQTYYINDVFFTFKAKTTPALTTPYSIVWGFASDVNYGETVINPYNSNTTLTKQQILALPNSGDFPAWTPEYRIRPPKRFYAGKKFKVRAGEFDSFMPAGTSAGNIALNWQNYAFAMYLTIDGVAPVPALPISDIYISLSLELCDMAPQQLFDAIGVTASTVTSSLMQTKQSLRSKGSESLLSTDDRELLDKLKMWDLKDRWVHGERLPHEPRRLIVSEDDDEVLYKDISAEIETKKKSSSIKSTKSNK